ncbi:MAG: carotenoid biosynthesis protein [Bacteroidales bacterium]
MRPTPDTRPHALPDALARERRFRLPARTTTGVLLLFYAVGGALYLVEPTRDLFRSLIPASLVLSFALVLLHQDVRNIRLGLAFALVWLFTFGVEVAGVATGRLFGSYAYGPALGPHVLHTPVLIGLNWLILLYGTASLTHPLQKRPILQVLAGAGAMVAYDLLLEIMAPPMHMWSFDHTYPGPLNFLMWFLVGATLHAFLRVLRIRIDNGPARSLFVIQFAFFALLSLHHLLT